MCFWLRGLTSTSAVELPPIENGETPQQHICMPVRLFPSAPGPLKWRDIDDHTSPCVRWYRWRTFWTFVVNCDLLNSKYWTAVELAECTVNVLCQFLVECYIIKVFIEEFNISVKLKNHFTKYHITNKCTNYISCILKHFSLLLHVSIAYRLSSSGSTYSS